LHRNKEEDSIGGKQFAGGLDRDIFIIRSPPMRPFQAWPS